MTKLKYRGYEIEIIRGKINGRCEVLAVAIVAGRRISARGKNAKVALKEVKSKIDGR